MRKLLRAASAATTALALAGCQNALADDPGPLTGTWRFTATSFQMDPNNSAITCDMTTTYVVTQAGNEVEGISPESSFTCQGAQSAGEPQPFSRGRVSGQVENGRLHVSNAGNWHCIAELHPTRLEGYLESYGNLADQPIQTVRSGTCVLEKLSDEGWDGSDD